MNREQLCQLLGWLQVPKESEMLGRGQHSVLLDRIETIVQQAVLAEREACAKVCEESDIVEYQHCMTLHDDAAQTLRNAAVAIRARGQE